MANRRASSGKHRLEGPAALEELDMFIRLADMDGNYFQTRPAHTSCYIRDIDLLYAENFATLTSTCMLGRENIVRCHVMLEFARFPLLAQVWHPTSGLPGPRSQGVKGRATDQTAEGT